MNKIKIATHSGSYHADDLFAIATLSILLGSENIEVVRTRDEDIINGADYVVDVGGILDPQKKRFDHHQREGAGNRENGVPYAAFGLVWKEYGEKLTGSVQAVLNIDTRLVQAIDGADNGMNLFELTEKGVAPYLIQSMFALFAPTWNEQKTNDEVFFELVPLAIKILMREIEVADQYVEAQKNVRDVYMHSDDKELIIFGGEHPYGRRVISGVLAEYPEPKYAVLYRPDNKCWQVASINVDTKTLEIRKALPEEWRGKKDSELQEVSGISGALFCHRTGFMAICQTCEDAVSLATKALGR